MRPPRFAYRLLVCCTQHVARPAAAPWKCAKASTMPSTSTNTGTVTKASGCASEESVDHVVVLLVLLLLVLLLVATVRSSKATSPFVDLQWSAEEAMNAATARCVLRSTLGTSASFSSASTNSSMSRESGSESTKEAGLWDDDDPNLFPPSDASRAVAITSRCPP